MEGNEHRETRECDICGYEMVYRRRVTRSTYVCPRSQDQNHVAERRIRRLRASIAEIERHLGSN
jgi:hypothetical protein